MVRGPHRRPIADQQVPAWRGFLRWPHHQRAEEGREGRTRGRDQIGEGGYQESMENLCGEGVVTERQLSWRHHAPRRGFRTQNADPVTARVVQRDCCGYSKAGQAEAKEFRQGLENRAERGQSARAEAAEIVARIRAETIDAREKQKGT